MESNENYPFRKYLDISLSISNKNIVIPSLIKIQPGDKVASFRIGVPPGLDSGTYILTATLKENGTKLY